LGAENPKFFERTTVARAAAAVLAETTKAGSQALPRESAFIVAPPGAQGPRDKARTGGASCRDRTEPTEVKLDD